MPYPALPDRRMPYDNDGTLVYTGTTTSGPTAQQSGATLIEWNDHDYVNSGPSWDSRQNIHTLWLFFPEQREITGIYVRHEGGSGGIQNNVIGSNDTTNGLDGTWETASLPAGVPAFANVFSWRDGIKPVSFTGPKQTVRFLEASSGSGAAQWAIVHVYGEAAAGQMTHDLVYINHDDTPGAEYTAPEDFGDQPFGTTVVRQFRIKNTSASKTATNVNIQCNDADFTIGESAAGPWVVTIVIPSLAPGAESATLYLRCTTPAVGAALPGPRHARIVTIADAGFFG